jgi:L-ascorbate metabolism protein UlaG (beta-lactamase superfamily)
MTFAPSDHFNGKTFHNPGEDPVRGISDVIKWKLTSRPAKWPSHVDVVRRPLPPAPASDGVVATWVGHATFILRTAGATILTDPIFSDVAGPLPWLGPRRVSPPGVDFDAVPRVDLVLLSHDHYDHCDLTTLRRLAMRDDPLVVAPLGHRSLLAGAGIGRVVELDWWERHDVPGGARVTLVPARHWCRRAPFRTNRRLWGGFMLQAGGRLVYFAGDSGYREGLFPEIGRRCGPPDLALVPIGAYEPRWFMRESHMSPAEAVDAHRELRSRRSIAMHWGTFQLTDEGFEDPVRALEAAAGEDVDFVSVKPGESVSI